MFIKLHEAAQEAQRREMNNLLNEAALDKYNFSEEFYRKKTKLLKRSRKPYYKLVNTAGKRAAVFILAIIVTLSTITLSVEALRMPLIEIITSIYERFTGVSYEYDAKLRNYPKKIEDVFLPKQVPKGYELVKSEYHDVAINTVFSNGTHDLHFEQYIIVSTKITVDTEGVEVEALTINGNEALFFHNKGINTLMWTDGYYGYIAHGNLDKSEIVKLVNLTKE